MNLAFEADGELVGGLFKRRRRPMVDQNGGVKEDFVTRPTGLETVIHILKIHKESLIQETHVLKDLSSDQDTGKGNELGGSSYFFWWRRKIYVLGEGEAPVNRPLESVKQLVVLTMPDSRGDQACFRGFGKSREKRLEEYFTHRDIRINN